ncbi:MAG: 30S ribosome-binding factor RbfA [Holosporales bacterium]|nr:30S ribosome-binding factor RbfA [Holosporales bacterium]
MQKKQLNLFVPDRAPSPRVKRVEREVRAILAEIFQRQSIPPVFDKDGQLLPFPGIITVTGVHMSADLRECRVYVMPLANKMLDQVLPYFEHAAPLIRKAFAQQSKMRVVPNFHFEIDASFATCERIDELLRGNKSDEPYMANETHACLATQV